jgi:hypothetical protein
MITVRFITPDDMPLLRQWAKRRGCVLDDDFLSPLGMLALNDNVPMLCAWAATILDTALMEIDHVYASPRVTKKIILECWSLLLGSFRHLAGEIANAGGRQVKAFKISANPAMIPFIKKTGGAISNHPHINCMYLA